ncbi:MAG: DEAD/DEAH box helicase, partial [Rhodoglobus sp.]|nr:DEAD/DEAH box helicase [Rhodoglobus sp.]
MSEIPAIHYPAELPVSQRRDDIARAIAENRVIIVAGATGSGKTTQLPKMLLELGYSSIAHTQPRRIAARTIAERVSEELGSELGGLVGYQVRFTDKAGPLTKIKLMTDGILLNQIHRDRDLTQYDAIIIDEAHERSLTVDFLLGYLKQLLERRPELKVVITSATIDPESFSKHFDGAPIIEVSGRTYPVEIRYRPLVAEAPLPEALDPSSASGAGSTTGSAPSSASGDENSDTSQDRDYLQGINDALDELARESDGDVLVFLSGENEIRDAEDAIRGRVSTGSTSVARFTDPTSDFLTLLNLWNYLQERQRELSGNQFRRLVKAEYLNYLRVREWQDVYRQLTRSAKQLGLHVGEPAVNGDAIHRSILSGLLSHIGLRDLAKKDYAGA